MVERTFFDPAPMTPGLVWALMAVFVLFLMLTFFGRKRQTVAEKIQNITDYGELMSIVFNKRGTFEGKENTSLLSIAMVLRDKLSPSDWAAIYIVAEADSELERVAEEKACNELED